MFDFVKFLSGFFLFVWPFLFLKNVWIENNECSLDIFSVTMPHYDDNFDSSFFLLLLFTCVCMFRLHILCGRNYFLRNHFFLFTRWISDSCMNAFSFKWMCVCVFNFANLAHCWCFQCHTCFLGHRYIEE